MCLEILFLRVDTLYPDPLKQHLTSLKKYDCSLNDKKKNQLFYAVVEDTTVYEYIACVLTIQPGNNILNLLSR